MIGIEVKIDDKYAYVTMNYRHIIENNWLDDLKYLCEPTEKHEKRISVKFVCDRGITHELVRHRRFSFVQESSRFCNYSKNKFGNEITCILPCWMNDEIVNNHYYNMVDIIAKTPKNNYTNDEFIFLQHLTKCEDDYFNLIKIGWKPQQARAVLPHAVKTEIIMTGFISDWIHFFKLRSNIAETGAPHPQMEELATPLMKEFINRNYITEKDVR